MRTNGQHVEAGPEPRRRGRSLNALALQLSAVALAFILVALLVVTSSQAAFVAQNDNTTNQVSSASIDLADNDEAAAMFQNVTGRCLPPTRNGASASPTRGTWTPLP